MQLETEIIDGSPVNAEFGRVVDLIVNNPRSFTFYQAVRLMERTLGGARLGTDALPRNEVIRLRALAEFGFPPWDIDDSFAEDNPWRNPAQRYVLTATFLGLYGPASPLPNTYTDILLRQQNDEDPEDRDRVRAFFDIFNHRFLSLFYRCLSKYRYHLSYEPGATDTFSRFMLALIGRSTAGMPDLPGSANRRPVSSERLLRYMGLLSQSPRSGVGLEGLLRDFLNLPVRIEQCTGRWLRVEDRNAMGGAFCTLGADLIVGANVYDRTGKFRISVGPVGFAEFRTFLPTGRLMAQVRELVRSYLVDELEFDLEVWLRGDEIPSMQLGSAAEAGGAGLLGWTSWAQTAPGGDRAVVFRG